MTQEALGLGWIGGGGGACSKNAYRPHLLYLYSIDLIFHFRVVVSKNAYRPHLWYLYFTDLILITGRLFTS